MFHLIFMQPMGDNKFQPSTLFGMEFNLRMENELQYVDVDMVCECPVPKICLQLSIFWKDTYLVTQCAAVSTHWVPIRAPPQRYWFSEFMSATWQLFGNE